MRALAFTHAREALEFVEVTAPSLVEGFAVVQLEAVGLGAADFGFFQLDALPRAPLIPGLEAVGVVVKSAASGLPVGARVGLGPLRGACGACPSCSAGTPAWCAKAALRGWHHDGYLSSHALVHPDEAVVLPSSVELAPVFASAWTAVAAVKMAGGGRLGVVGLGGVGQLVVQVARTAGLTVFAHDVDADRAAASLGTATPLQPESVDACVVCTPSTQAIQHAVRAVRRGGAVVLAAASPAVRFDLSLFDTVMRGVILRPVFLGSRVDLSEAVAQLSARALVPRVFDVPVAEVPREFWRLRDGGFVGRLVARW